MEPTQEQVVSQPQNSIDIDSDETQKIFSDAMNEALGKEVVKTVVDTPAPVIEEKKEEPVVEAAKVETPAAEVKAAAEPTKEETKVPVVTDNQPEWLKSVPEDIREKVLSEIKEKEKFSQWFSSEKGRWTSWKNRSEQAERELSLLRAQVQKPQDPALAAAAKADSEKTLAEWNALIEADPNLGKAFEARLSAERQQYQAALDKLNQKVEAQVNPLNQHIQSTAQEEERRLLQEAVPNYTEVINSPVYDYWLKNVTSEGIRTLAQTSVDHNDAIHVLQLYAQQAQHTYDQMVHAGVIKAEPQTTQTSPAVEDKGASTTSHADKVAQSRQQRLTETPVVTKSPTVMASPTSDPFGPNSIGGQVDLDNPAVLALFEQEVSKALRR